MRSVLYYFHSKISMQIFFSIQEIHFVICGMKSVAVQLRESALEWIFCHDLQLILSPMKIQFFKQTTTISCKLYLLNRSYCSAFNCQHILTSLNSLLPKQKFFHSDLSYFSKILSIVLIFIWFETSLIKIDKWMS